MAKLTTEKIIEALPSLNDDDLKEISKATASELGRREKELENAISENNARLQAIRSNGGK